MNKVTCPKCQAENTADAQFCHSCGAPLTAPAASSEVSTPASADTASSTSTKGVVYAGFWLRVVAAIIDGIILEIVAFIVGMIIGAVTATIGGQGAVTSGTIISGLTGLVIGWLYYALMESSPKQATFGKQALGLKVTDMNGNRINFGQATGRYFAKIISSIILGIGYLMAAFTEKKQALHDIIVGTLVIKH